MAIASYTDLVTSVQNWSALTGTAYTDRIDEIIGLCEQRICYGDETVGNDPLRVRGMEATSDLSISTQSTSLPTGFLESRGLYLNTSVKGAMPYYPPDRFWESVVGAQSTTGQPAIYTIEGDNIVVAPSPDATYTGKLLAYTKPTGLSASNSTNWIITNAPSVYLYGCLLEQAIFDKNDTEIKKQGGLFKGAINSLNTQDRRARYSGSTLTVKTDNTP